MDDAKIREWAQRLDENLTAATGLEGGDIILEAARELLAAQREEDARICEDRAERLIGTGGGAVKHEDARQADLGCAAAIRAGRKSK